ncbi:MAG: hypothetical protein WCM76_04015 [Bacteroidota bacterium]
MLLILLKSNLAYKLVQVVLMSGIKFIFAPPLSIESGLNYFQTIGATTAGGIAGIFFFYHLSGGIIRLYRIIRPKVKALFIVPEATHENQQKHTNKRKKIFTWKNKLIVKIRSKYGMAGIVILTPILLSIPIGAFLANKYYSRNKNILLYLSASIIFWSFSISTIYFFTF